MSFYNLQSIKVDNAVFRGGCTDELNNQLLLIDSNNGLIHKFKMDTLARLEPYIPLSNNTPLGIALLSTTSAIVMFASLNTVDVVELAGGYRSTYSITTSTPSFGNTAAKGQLIASDIDNKIAVTITTQPLINIFSGNTFSAASTNNIVIRIGTSPSCVIYKEPNRFFVGTTAGEIYEMDSLGTFRVRMELSNPNTTGNTLSIMNPRIVSMSWDNNLLLVATEPGIIYLIDWSTRSVIRTISSNNTAQGYLLSNSASGMCIGGIAPATTVNKVINELDFTINPVTIGTVPACTPSTTQLIDLGINVTTGRAWAVQQVTTVFTSNANPVTANIYFMDLNVRPTTARNIVVQNPVGVDVKARVTLMDLVSGNQILDTYIQSPGTYRVPTNKPITELIKIGDGTNSLWDLSQYIT